MADVLRATGLTKSFGAVRASRDVSLAVRPGEIHAVIGPNGAGKSTLIAQLCGGVRPDAGTVHLDGVDVTAWGTAARARAGIARTFQITALPPEGTVREVATLAALRGRRPGLWGRALGDRALRAIADDALERTGLAPLAEARVATLAHGQARGLELAAALAMSPSVFVMDEPMAGLGQEGTARLVPLLRDLKRAAPILLVEHDMDAVFALADRVTVLVDGAVLATGTPDAIRADAAVRAAYLGDEC